MPKLRDLAARADFQRGPLHVSPSRRLVTGPAGEAHLEPLIMHVFLLLLDANGRVVTRDELFDQCWGGVMVGDDSLNRAIGKVRRIASDVAPGLFEIETIPRTGYRLTGEIVGHAQSDAAMDAGERVRGSRFSRRALVGGSLAAAVVAGGGGLWWATRDPVDPRYSALMREGAEAFRSGSAFDHFTPLSSKRLLDVYEEAVRIEPDSAAAWGLVAYFRSARAEDSGPENAERFLALADEAIARAFELDPREPNALAARYLLEGPMLDWPARDRRLRSILEIDPNNIPAMTELMTLLQAAGLTRESWSWNERILNIAPFSRPHLVIRSLKLWIVGRNAASDKVIDRVRSLWPSYEFGYSRRFLLFALTGRTKAAQAMLTSNPGAIGPPRDVAVWNAALQALDSGSPSAITAARDACLDAARQAPQMVNNIVMLLGALGQTDAAFDVTDGFLLWRGKLVSADQSNGKLVNDYSRRMTQWLFTPPLAEMRADPRFLRLCDEFGLGDYWRSRAVRPDYIAYA